MSCEITPKVTACLTLLAQVSASALLAAQVPDTSANPADTSLAVYVVTVGPGARVWERFGHNAILIHDANRGSGRAYNYGIFSFGPGFLGRFLRGEMLYRMAGFEAESHLRSYIADNRSVWLQELRLTQAQRAELTRFLDWNELPENAYYRYDYYWDNCSTRVRDALDRVLAGRIRAQTQGKQSGTTFRSHTTLAVSHDLLLYTGLLIGLGRPVDRPLSAWDEMFSPLMLRMHLRDVTVLDDQGREVPLVVAEQTLFQSTNEIRGAGRSPWLLTYLVFGVGLAGVMLVLAHRATRSRGARWGFVGLASGWMALVGLLGVTLAALWMLTDHTASRANENLLLFSPLALVLAVSLPLSMRRGSRARRLTTWLCVAVAVSSLVGFVLQLLPGFYQVNGGLFALALPPNVGVVLAVRRLGEVS